MPSCAQPELREVLMWARALVCELHDRDYWPNEARFLADVLRRADALPERVAKRIGR